jgi:hypothetical protein
MALRGGATADHAGCQESDEPMKNLRRVAGWMAVTMLVATDAIVAPAQGADARQRWSVMGVRIAPPIVELQTIAGERTRLRVVTARDETYDVDAPGFSVEPTSTGVAIRARGRARVTAAGAQVPLRDATFEMTLSRDGVVNVWASGDPVR